MRYSHLGFGRFTEGPFARSRSRHVGFGAAKKAGQFGFQSGDLFFDGDGAFELVEGQCAEFYCHRGVVIAGFAAKVNDGAGRSASCRDGFSQRRCARRVETLPPLRYRVATMPREVRVRKLRGL